MKKLLTSLACAAALSLTAGAQAAIVTFDSPGVIDIDNTTNVATYHEAGFRFAGDAASYLPIDGIGSSGTGGLLVFANSTLTFTAGGGLFSLLALDYGLFDPQATGMLDIHGIFGDNSQLTETRQLGNLPGFSFQGWSNLKEVSFSANADFVLDNVSAVPEPGSMALLLAGLPVLALARRRRSLLNRDRPNGLRAGC